MFNTSILAFPDRYSPPTNSLPPRLWAALAEATRGECGDRGALRKLSVEGVIVFGGARRAPGLNEKSGNAADADGLLSLLVVVVSPNAKPASSIADFGRLREVRAVVGVEADIDIDIGLDGNTNGGFGGGPLGLRVSSGVSSGSLRPMVCRCNGSERWRGL